MVCPNIYWDSSVVAVTWARGWTTSNSRFSEYTRELSVLQKVIEVVDSTAVSLWVKSCEMCGFSWHQTPHVYLLVCGCSRVKPNYHTAPSMLTSRTVLSEWVLSRLSPEVVPACPAFSENSLRNCTEWNGMKIPAFPLLDLRRAAAKYS
jgi:hypothetical protein